MSHLTQKTIKKPVTFSGIALHNGLNVNVTLKSAKPNEGIVFKRVDLKDNNLVYPNFLNVTNTSLNTTIENEHGVKVSTIEHLMGALFGLGIDNVLIEIDKLSLNWEQDVNHYCNMPQLLTPNAGPCKPAR